VHLTNYSYNSIDCSFSGYDSIIINIANEDIKIEFKVMYDKRKYKTFCLDLKFAHKLFIEETHSSILFFDCDENNSRKDVPLKEILKGTYELQQLPINEGLASKVTISRKYFDNFENPSEWYKLYDFESDKFIEDKSPETINLWKKVESKKS